MKQSKKAKSKRSLWSMFGKSKRENSLDAHDNNLDKMKFAEPHNEEIYLGEESTVTNNADSTTSLSLDEMEDSSNGIKILRPKNVRPRKPIYVKKIDVNKYCDSLSVYLSDNGLSVEKNTIREMFSSMAASRLIIVSNNNPLISVRFIELFSEFIGANFFIDHVKDSKKFEDLFLSASQFKEAIVSSDNDVNLMNIVSLRDVELETMDQYLQPVIDFAFNPLLAHEIENSNFSSVSDMPKNIWFTIIPTQSSALVMTEALAQSAITIELNAKIIKPKEEVFQNEFKLSYEYMSNLLLEGYEQFYLEETSWKKIDKIEQYLNENSSFVLDNRIFRQLERFTSTYLMFGGDKYEAMDTVLYAKLLPIISLLRLSSNQDSDEGIFQLFEKQFGLEYLTRSKRILKQLQESNRKK